MKNFKKTFAFIFFMLAGIILGAFIAYVCEGKDYVGWLAVPSRSSPPGGIYPPALVAADLYVYACSGSE